MTVSRKINELMRRKKIMAVVSFLLPIVGWITWGVKRNTDPELASRCARWASIGVGVGLLLSFAMGGA